MATQHSTAAEAMAGFRPKWTPQQDQALLEMRTALGDKLMVNGRDKMRELVGDRRLLRFLRGSNYDVQLASGKYSKFLEWREANGVDAIRNDILNGSGDPHLFPHGAKILENFPQIIISATSRDLLGNPVSVERYNFSPSDALRNVQKEDYKVFAIYCLEYKVLVMEQLAHEQEQASLRERAVGTDPYGVILSSFYLRDFDGFQLSYVGGEGQVLVGWVLETATANYPDLLYQSHLVNVPWFFNLLWIFVSPFLDSNTLAKIYMHSYGGETFVAAVKDKIAKESLPDFLGGTWHALNEAFAFDLSARGPFYVASPENETQEQKQWQQSGQDEGEERGSQEEALTVSPIDLSFQQSPRRAGLAHSPTLQHKLLMNPYAWLLYLRIVVLVPVANVFTRVGSKPVVSASAAVLGAIAVSASSVINNLLLEQQEGTCIRNVEK